MRISVAFREREGERGGGGGGVNTIVQDVTLTVNGTALRHIDFLMLSVYHNDIQNNR